MVVQNQTDHLHLIPYSIFIDFYENLSDKISAIRFALFLLHSPLQIFDKDFEIPSWSKYLIKEQAVSPITN